MSHPAQITLLTQSSCGLCDHAKEVLSRVGRDYPLRITEIAVAPSWRRVTYPDHG